MTDRLARIADRRPGRIALIAVLFFLLAGAFGGSVADHLGPYGDDDPRSESVKADRALEEAGYRSANTSVLIEGVDVRRSPADRRKVERIRAEILARPGIRDAIGFGQTGSPAFVSRDGRSTLILVSLDSTDDQRQQQVAVALAETLERRHQNLTVGGVPLATEQINAQIERDLQRAELMVFPLLLLLSLLFFRGLVAAILPLLVGALAIVGTFLALRIATGFGEISFFALNLTVGLGLGLAIDYSLLIVSRYREEIAAQGPGLPALRRTLATAGRSVMFSSITVAASMAALLIFPQRFLYSMGLGGVVVALLAATVSLTVLPALLTLLGDRVNALSPRFLQRRKRAGHDSPEHGFWYRLSRFVMARPGPIAAVTILLLLLVAIPALRMVFVSVDTDVLPRENSVRAVQETLEGDFPAGAAEQIRILVEGGDTDARAVAAGVRATEGIAGVRAPLRLDRGSFLIEADSKGGYMTPVTERAVDSIRGLPAPPGAEVKVTGGTASFLDFQQSLLDHLPFALAIIIAATLIVLFLMTGSVVLPVKSLLMNLLTLGAVFGLLVLIFQDGNLSGPLAFSSIGGIDQATPILIVAITFGLSTDYAVFLLSRIKEVRDSGASDSEAVAIGLERTGRIVTAAALLFALAVGAFASSEIVVIKELGVGTALAVLIDATVIRALLVPSLMKLLGRRNWWAPRPLRRLHDRWGLSEGEPAPAMTGTDRQTEFQYPPRRDR